MTSILPFFLIFSASFGFTANFEGMTMGRAIGREAPGVKHFLSIGFICALLALAGSFIASFSEGIHFLAVVAMMLFLLSLLINTIGPKRFIGPLIFVALATPLIVGTEFSTLMRGYVVGFFAIVGFFVYTTFLVMKAQSADRNQ